MVFGIKVRLGFLECLGGLGLIDPKHNPKPYLVRPCRCL